MEPWWPPQLLGRLGWLGKVLTTDFDASMPEFAGDRVILANTAPFPPLHAQPKRLRSKNVAGGASFGCHAREKSVFRPYPAEPARAIESQPARSSPPRCRSKILERSYAHHGVELSALASRL